MPYQQLIENRFHLHHINPQLQAYFDSQQQQQQQSQSSSSLFSSNLVNDPAIAYQQQPQRSISTKYICNKSTTII